MKRFARENLSKTFMGSVGWLFADLLLALSMLFLLANTISLPKPPLVHAQKPTAKATSTLKPTPTPPPHLEQNYHPFTITIDPNKLFSNDAGERNAVIQQVEAQQFLNNRHAGLIVAYGGAPTDNDIGTAFKISDAIYGILLDLGKHDPTFSGVARYKHLYTLGASPTTVEIDIFLFAQ